MANSINVTRRQVVQAAAGGAIALVAIPARSQETWPAKPLRMVVAFPAGGLADVVARTIAEAMSRSLRQTIFVDNKPGGSGIIAADFVARSAPDGYTVFFTPQGALIQNKILFSKLPYSPETDFSLIGTYGRTYTGLFVNETLRVANLREFVALSKRQNKLPVGSAGNGTPGHISVESMNNELGASLRHVPYKGEAPLLQDLLGGHIGAGALSFGTMRSHVRSGAFKLIAVMGNKRTSEFPEVPTFLEQGASAAAFSLVPWQCLSVRAGTPRPVVERLAGALSKALEEPDVKRRITETGTEVEYIGPERLATLYKTDLPLWAKVLTDLGLKGSAG